MTSAIRSALRSIGAVLAGFAVIALGTLFTFTVLVGDFGYATSGPIELMIGTLGALASGLAGGLVAARLAATHPLRHAAALAVPIALDTASIVASAGPESDPLWFDLGGSAILLLGAVVGGCLAVKRPRAQA
jgi:hypothetical protein